MTVRVQSILLAGGAPATTSFADTFTRADTTGGLGNNWVGLGNDQLAVSPGHYSAARILSNHARFFLAGSGGGTPAGEAYIPLPVAGNLLGKNQFCQFVVSAINITVASLEIGGCLAMQGDPLNGTATCYSAFYANSTTSMNFVVWGGSNFQTAIYTLQNNITVALGDTIRMNVSFAAGANTVNILRNGANVFNAVDNNASRPGIAGCPGLYVGVANAAGSTCDVASFSCGLGA